jgi:hypothetical protein
MTCTRCATPIEAGDLRCAICGLVVPGDASGASARPRLDVLRCGSCGAAVAYDASVQAPKCAFCASVMVLERIEDPMEQAEHLLPFRVGPDHAHDALRAWMKTLGWWRPSDLASESTIHQLRPIWWAAWIFDAKALVSWTADSDHGNRRSSWAPHAGQINLEFERILVSASRGLAAVEAARLAPWYDLRTATQSAEGPAGAVVESFDVQRSAARRRIVEACEAESASRAQHGHVPGSRFRNVRAAVVLHGLRTHRMALPSWILAYRYRDTLYRAIVHGQDPRCVFGAAPISYRKIALVVLAVIAGLAALGALAVLILALLAQR